MFTKTATTRAVSLFVVCCAVTASAALAQTTIPYQFTTVDLPLEIPFLGQLRPDIVRFTDLNSAETLIGVDFAQDGFVVTLPQTVEEIICPGDTREDDNTTVAAISNGGDIVGNCTGTGTGPRATAAFLRTADGTITLLQFPGADGTLAFGVNDAGQIVGQYFGVAFGSGQQRFHGFVWHGGVFTTMDAPFDGAQATALLGINNAGQMIGTALHHRDGSPDVNDTDRGFVFLVDQGVFTEIAPPEGQAGLFVMDLNNVGQVLLSTDLPPADPRVFLWQAGVFTEITGLPTPMVGLDVAWGFNDQATLVGSYILQIPCAACGIGGEPDVTFARHSFVARPRAVVVEEPPPPPHERRPPHAKHQKRHHHDQDQDHLRRVWQAHR